MEVKEEYEISNSIIQRRLKLFGPKPRKYPYLSQTNLVKFCKVILDFENWSKVLFSDVSRFIFHKSDGHDMFIFWKGPQQKYCGGGYWPFWPSWFLLQ